MAWSPRLEFQSCDFPNLPSTEVAGQLRDAQSCWNEVNKDGQDGKFATYDPTTFLCYSHDRTQVLVSRENNRTPAHLCRSTHKTRATYTTSCTPHAESAARARKIQQICACNYGTKPRILHWGSGTPSSSSRILPWMPVCLGLRRVSRVTPIQYLTVKRTSGSACPTPATSPGIIAA